jgi:hypothetical protein
MSQRLLQYDSDFEALKTDFLDDLSYAGLPSSTRWCQQGGRMVIGMDSMHSDAEPDELLLRRTAELWAGLRRVYFGEFDDVIEEDDKEPSFKRQRTRQTMAEFKREISETRTRIRASGPRIPDDLNLPPPILPRNPDYDDGDDDLQISLATPPSSTVCWMKLSLRMRPCRKIAAPSS